MAQVDHESVLSTLSLWRQRGRSPALRWVSPYYEFQWRCDICQKDCILVPLVYKCQSLTATLNLLFCRMCFAKCYSVECHSDICHSGESHYGKYYSCECHYSKYHSVECHRDACHSDVCISGCCRSTLSISECSKILLEEGLNNCQFVEFRTKF